MSDTPLDASRKTEHESRGKAQQSRQSPSSQPRATGASSSPCPRDRYVSQHNVTIAVGKKSFSATCQPGGTAACPVGGDANLSGRDKDSVSTRRNQAPTVGRITHLGSLLSDTSQTAGNSKLPSDPFGRAAQRLCRRALMCAGGRLNGTSRRVTSARKGAAQEMWLRRHRSLCGSRIDFPRRPPRTAKRPTKRPVSHQRLDSQTHPSPQRTMPQTSVRARSTTEPQIGGKEIGR